MLPSISMCWCHLVLLLLTHINWNLFFKKFTDVLRFCLGICFKLPLNYHSDGILLHSFLLPPISPRLAISPQEEQLLKLPLPWHIYKSLYLFLDSEQKLDKSKKFDNPGMEVQFKIAFKRYYFFATKIQKQIDPARNCATDTSFNPYFKISTPFILLPPLHQIS